MELSHMSDLTSINMLAENMKAKFGYLPKQIEGMEVYNIDQFQVVNASLQSDTFNTIFGGKPTLSQARSIMEHTIDINMPMAWWCIGSIHDVQAPMINAGFVLDEHDIGMSCMHTELSIEPSQPASQLRIEPCNDEKTMLDFGAVLASIFDPVDQAVQSFYQRCSILSYEQMESMTLLVGYEGDVPVTTGAIFSSDTCAGIYDIATHPDMRRRGYGSAMFQETVRLAIEMGHSHIVLSASEKGQTIYERNGFVPICDITVWSNAESLS